MNEEGTNDLVVVRVLSAIQVDEPAPGSWEVVVEKEYKQIKIVLVGGTGAVESFFKYSWEDFVVLYSKMPRDKFRPLTLKRLFEVNKSGIEPKGKSGIVYIDSEY
jgi:hypothetical protein